MKSIHASFKIKKGLSIIKVNGYTLPTPATEEDIVAAFPCFFFFENNTNGVRQLSVTKMIDQPLHLTVTDGTDDHVVEATPFEPVYFLDGHPTSVPIFRPK